MLQISDLVYRLGDRTLLDGASAVVPTGARVGLFGRNGAGKTTLFKLIAGDLAPESGTISLPNRARIGGVAQEVPSGPEALLEIVLAADTERAGLLARAETETDPHEIAAIHARLADIEAHSAESRAARILSGLGFDHAAQQRPASEYSGGWRMRVALAAVLFSAPDLLLLDEPTNYLDLEGALWLENYLASYPHSLLLISHDRDLLDNAVDHILHLDQGKLTAYRGGYTSFDRQRRERALLQTKMRERQEAARAHMQAFVDRFRAKATKARQAQSRLKMLEKMDVISAVIEDRVKPFSFPSPTRPQSPPLIAAEGVAVGYEPDKPILQRLDFRLDPDDRIALLGANGNGKSTLAKLIAGRLQAEKGKLSRAGKLDIAFFAQHQLEELRPEASAVEHVRALIKFPTEAKVRARTAAMGFDTQRMDTPAKDLSGGERARLLLGIVTFHGPHVLILDEPTNHLDVESREALVRALADYEGAVILISHDRHLVEATVDRLWLVADGTMTVFEGDVSDYRTLVLQGKSKKSPGATAAPQQQDKRREAAQKRETTQGLRDKIADAEARIDKIRAEISRIDVLLADPALFTTDPDKGARLARRRSEGEAALEQWEEHWIRLSDDLDRQT
ncbi:MAG: ABC-F family ATP-binding cassette domain-containing protein [Hyphomicrobiaceae bacterium]|nr:ABC-F family ATP-binding cassette domain-containing protein [Hyphomicrobiaceae bacterium]